MKIKVCKFPTNPGPAAWNALLPQAREYPSLGVNTTADFLIVGAGFAGLAAARRLHQLSPDSKITVLEAGRVAEGPAGRNSGFMIDLPHNLGTKNYAGNAGEDRVRTAMNREAIEFSRESTLEYNMPEEAFSMSGKINAAASSKGVDNNRNYAAHLGKLGEPFELLDQDTMRELCGSAYYQSGLFTPGTATIQPALFVRSIAQGLHQQGIEVFENSPVVSMVNSARDWSVSTPTANVVAHKVILAVNGHVESFGFFKRRLMHIYLYASMTRAMNKTQVATLGGHPTWAFTPADPLGTSVRRICGTGGDRIVIRNRFTWSPARSVSDKKLAAIAPVHDRSFNIRFPSLKDLPMEYRWGGLLCLSRNNVPAFGTIESNLYSACCQNGLGSVMGTLSGKLAAELALGNSTHTLDAMLNYPSPDTLPPEPFATIGANAFMRWSEFRAGGEL